MSKPLSGLFRGTRGERFHMGDAETVIAERAVGLDLREHPLQNRQLSAKQVKAIRAKIVNRTATREEYEAYMWQRRFSKRRRAGIDSFWEQEADRLLAGLQGTRNWSPGDIERILSGRKPRRSGRPIEGHHTFSAVLYPHLANCGEIIYPATHFEHLQAWHGGNYRKSLPGRRIRRFNEF